MRICLLVSTLLACAGCVGIEAGTHGSLKGYRYSTSKYVLEKVVHNVITKSNLFVQDSVKDYYNDDTAYITLHFPEGEYVYKYTFRYYGDKEYWDTSSTAEIFIAIVHTEMRDGRSVPVRKYNAEVKKELTERFEHAFISKIDSSLGMNHKVES